MNLVYGEIIALATEEGMPVGKIRVHGATKKKTARTPDGHSTR